MNYLLVLFLGGVLLTGCKKNIVDVMSMNLKVYINNSEGDDLLNPNMEGSFKLEDLKIEFEKEPEIEYSISEILVSKPSIWPDNNGEYYLQLYPNGDKEPVNVPESWVKVYWPDGSSDKITFGMERSSNMNVTTNYILLNDNKVWGLDNPLDKNGQRRISITK